MSYLPSTCPFPENAFTLGLKGTCSSCLWSSMLRCTSLPLASLISSAGTSLPQQIRQLNLVCSIPVHQIVIYRKLTNALCGFLYISIYYKHTNSLCKQNATLHDWTEISKVLVGWSCHSRWTLLWRQSRKINQSLSKETGNVYPLQHSIVSQNLIGRF